MGGPNISVSDKRVLFLAPQPFYLERGSSFRTLATVSTLAELGFTVDLIAFSGGERINVPGVRVLRTPRLLFLQKEIPVGFSLRKLVHGTLLFLMAIRQLLRRRYVAIHSVEESTLFASILSSLFRVPYVADSYSDVAVHLKRLKEGSVGKQLAARLLFTSLSGAAGIISNSGQQYQFSEDQTACSVGGLPLTLYREPSHAEQSKTGRTYQLFRRRVVLYTGTFAANDGIELLLRSFAALLESQRLSHEERAGLCLVLAGNSCRGDQLKRYRRLALHLGIEHRVLFTGRSAGEHFSSLVAWADTVVCPKLDGEDPSIKLYSYLSAGKKVVATAIPAHTKILDSNTAFLPEPTIESFIDALHASLSYESHAVAQQSAMRANATRRSNEIFSAGLFRSTLARLYQNVLSDENSDTAPRRSLLALWKSAGDCLHTVQFGTNSRMILSRRIPSKLKKFGSHALLSFEQLQQEYSFLLLLGLEEAKLLL